MNCDVTYLLVQSMSLKSWDEGTLLFATNSLELWTLSALEVVLVGAFDLNGVIYLWNRSSGIIRRPIMWTDIFLNEVVLIGR